MRELPCAPTSVSLTRITARTNCAPKASSHAVAPICSTSTPSTPMSTRPPWPGCNRPSRASTGCSWPPLAEQVPARLVKAWRLPAPLRPRRSTPSGRGSSSDATSSRQRLRGRARLGRRRGCHRAREPRRAGRPTGRRRVRVRVGARRVLRADRRGPPPRVPVIAYASTAVPETLWEGGVPCPEGPGHGGRGRRRGDGRAATRIGRGSARWPTSRSNARGPWTPAHTLFWPRESVRPYGFTRPERRGGMKAPMSFLATHRGLGGRVRARMLAERLVSCRAGRSRC